MRGLMEALTNLPPRTFVVISMLMPRLIIRWMRPAEVLDAKVEPQVSKVFHRLSDSSAADFFTDQI